MVVKAGPNFSEQDLSTPASEVHARGAVVLITRVVAEAGTTVGVIVGATTPPPLAVQMPRPADEHASQRPLMAEKTLLALTTEL